MNVKLRTMRGDGVNMSTSFFIVTDVKLSDDSYTIIISFDSRLSVVRQLLRYPTIFIYSTIGRQSDDIVRLSYNRYIF